MRRGGDMLSYGACNPTLGSMCGHRLPKQGQSVKWLVVSAWGLVSLLCGPPESSFDADRVVGFEIIGIMTEQEGQLRPV